MSPPHPILTIVFGTLWNVYMMKHTNMLDSIKIFIIIVFLKQKESYAAGGSKCIQQSTFIKNR